MIGVILWSDPDQKKAVIWCEDHGELAFLSRPDQVHLPEAFVDVGDVVEFDLIAQSRTRRVEDYKIISEGKGAPAVQSLMSEQAGSQSGDGRSADVIPFRLSAPMHAQNPRSEPYRRRV